jgi:hypothetical protein
MWGRKSDVEQCVRAHNDVIRELAHQNSSDVVLVDQAKYLSTDGQNFIDVCHFTDRGCRLFVDHLLTVLNPQLKARLLQSRGIE